MHATNPFLAKFASSIIAVLSCHDRVIFEGHLPFSDEVHLDRFVDGILRIPRKDFLAFAEHKSELFVSHAKDFAARQGTLYFYLYGRHRKEDLVQQQIRERCRLRRNPGRVEMRNGCSNYSLPAWQGVG
jgi:hypothetical protein